jgi:hypothetical protein
MAFETPILDTTVLAAADLSSSQFCGVVINSSGQAALPAAGANIAGVVQNKPTSGTAVELRVEGITKMKTGGTVAPGAYVKVDTSGQAVTAASGDKIVGICLSTASVASGNLATVLLKSGVAV